VSAPGKSPSAWRAVVIAGAVVALASAMTPVSAAPVRKSTAVKKQAHPSVHHARPLSGGGGTGPLSVEWSIVSPLRP